MLDLGDTVVNELKKLSKPAFNIDELMTTAGDLKYTREIKRLLAEQMESPSDELIKLLASKVFNGPLTPGRREYFAGIIKRSYHQLVNDHINLRLKSAMTGDVPTQEEAAELIEEGEEVVTTEEELEGFFIVKTILRELVDPGRIVHRDTLSYMGILLDDNNRKTIARLHFNRSQKYLGVFDENKKETRIPLASVDNIYEHADKLRRVLAFYESGKKGKKEGAEAATQDGGQSGTEG